MSNRFDYIVLLALFAIWTFLIVAWYWHPWLELFFHPR